MLRTPAALVALLLTLTACAHPDAGRGPPPAALTPEAAQAFVKEANAELGRLSIRAEVAEWIKATYITDDTEQAAAWANEALMAFLSEAVVQAARYAQVEGLDADTARQLELLRRQPTLPAPPHPEKRAELARIASELEGIYGKGEWCGPEGKGPCRDLGALEDVLAESRDWDALLDAWVGWRTISPPMRAAYAREVELANEGARSIGFADVGHLWRSGYDMPPEAFEAEVERLWQQVRPLYEKLHCYVRARLSEQYGKERVPLDGPIPAHLLGNMWAQEWSNVYELVEPHPGASSLDVGAALAKQGWTPKRMSRTSEAFFTSLGLPELPETFWSKSMFVKPEDRSVVCHASAWHMDMDEDVRIKMCIKPTYEDLVTIHHELGHVYYYLHYKDLPPIYQRGAHDGFHEAIGDAVVLSMTPAYLEGLGLLDATPENEAALINVQMKDALDRVAFLPFGRMIDQWRWEVFAGRVAPEDYNEAWWRLRQQYQGVAAPAPRGKDAFDPGAKYHIPANTPYARYFLAHILQFQFHQAMCRIAGNTGPLHACSIHGNREAGARLAALLEVGMSRPWPDALEALTGTRQMDASALLEYFAPLSTWLDAQNEGRACGW